MPMGSASKLISTTHPSLHLSHPTPDSFVWNTLIRARPQLLRLSLYGRMRLHGALPDTYTFPFLLHSLSSPLPGRQLHAHALLSGLASHPFVTTSLINRYSLSSSPLDALQIFRQIPLPDPPSYNSIISSALKSGSLSLARHLFDTMPNRNVVTWSTMIDGLVKCGDYKHAVELFRSMQREGLVRPNQFTVSSALLACNRLGALELGEWMHSYINRSGMAIGPVLGTSLIDMYAKCGSIERARWVFDELGPHRDVTAWSAMISGLAIHGLVDECLATFHTMLRSGFKPNAVTLIGVLCACVHGGLVDKGTLYFERMRDEFGIEPTIEHYGCVVDLYARVGLIYKAWDVASSMPMKPDVLIWGALLSGSRIHCHIEACEHSIKQLIELEPNNSGAYVLLSNAYAKMSRWDDVRRVRRLMDEMGIKKTPGCSLVEFDGLLHEFFAGDRSHPETQEIYRMLEEMMERLKVAGYAAETKEVLFELDEEGKEVMLLLHSEKLAIAFSFIKTRPGTAIRVIKNIRMCTDCHVYIKLVSKVYEREIVVRDCSRFHYFREGSCSCKDYW